MAFKLPDFLNFKKQNKPGKQEEIPAVPEKEPAEQHSFMTLTNEQIDQELSHIIRDDRTLFEVLDEMANRLIGTSREPHLSTGMHLQDIRSQMTSPDMPFFDYDTALIAAVEQMESYCNHAPATTLETALSRLDDIFEARKNPAVNTRRSVLQLKSHYLNAQLISLQGQLFNSASSIAEYRKLLTQYETNKALDPLGQRATYIKQQLEHTEKMQQVLTDNIGTLKTTITTTSVEMNTAPLETIDPKAALQSTIELINEQREVYKSFLRQRSDFQQLLELINKGATEITVLERATEQQVAESVRRIEAERIMREKRAAYTAYDPAKNQAPVATTAEIEAEPRVEASEETTIEPAPQMIDFL